MKKIERKDLWLLLVQVAVWVIIMLALPIATYLSTQDFHATKTSFFVVWGIMHSPFIIYFANFYLFGPFLFFKRRFWLFGLCNLLAIVALNSQFLMLWFARDRIPEMPEMTPNMWIGFFSGVLTDTEVEFEVDSFLSSVAHLLSYLD